MYSAPFVSLEHPLNARSFQIDRSEAKAVDTRAAGQSVRHCSTAWRARRSRWVGQVFLSTLRHSTATAHGQHCCCELVNPMSSTSFILIDDGKESAVFRRRTVFRHIQLSKSQVSAAPRWLSVPVQFISLSLRIRLYILYRRPCAHATPRVECDQ